MTQLETIRRNTEKAYQDALKAMFDLVNAITEERNYYRDLGYRKNEQAQPASDTHDFEKEPYTMAEVVARLAPHDGKAGEWYTDGTTDYLSWRIDVVDGDGRIVRKLCHNEDEQTVTSVELPAEPETVNELAKCFVELGYYFLKDRNEED